MTDRRIKDIAASIRQRLRNNAETTGRPFHEVLQYFAMERFLYRLAQSVHSDRFVLKGALMFTVWQAPFSRPVEQPHEGLLRHLVSVTTVQLRRHDSGGGDHKDILAPANTHGRSPFRADRGVCIGCNEGNPMAEFSSQISDHLDFRGFWPGGRRSGGISSARRWCSRRSQSLHGPLERAGAMAMMALHLLADKRLLGRRNGFAVVAADV